VCLRWCERACCGVAGCDLRPLGGSCCDDDGGGCCPGVDAALPSRSPWYTGQYLQCAALSCELSKFLPHRHSYRGALSITHSHAALTRTRTNKKVSAAVIDSGSAEVGGMVGVLLLLLIVQTTTPTVARSCRIFWTSLSSAATSASENTTQRGSTSSVCCCSSGIAFVSVVFVLAVALVGSACRRLDCCCGGGGGGGAAAVEAAAAAVVHCLRRPSSSSILSCRARMLHTLARNSARVVSLIVCFGSRFFLTKKKDSTDTMGYSPPVINSYINTDLFCFLFSGGIYFCSFSSMLVQMLHRKPSSSFSL